MESLTNDPNKLSRLIALGCVNAIGAIALLITPGLLSAMVTELGFSNQHAGYVISAELWGWALAALPAVSWVRRVHWHRTLYASLTVLIIVNLFSAALSSPVPLAAIRFIGGFTGGSILAISTAAIYLTTRPDRSFAIFFAVQLLIASIGLLLLPHLVAAASLSGAFLLFAFILIALVFIVRYLPERRDTQSSTRKGTRETTALGWAMLALSGAFAFEFAMVGVWAYLGRMGSAANLPVATVSFALSMGMLAGLFGSIAAAALDIRLGRLLPLSVGVACYLLAVAPLLGNYSGHAFVFHVSLFGFAWYFLIPYIMASIVNIDLSGRLIVLTNGIMGMGIAAGPALGAYLQTADSFAPVIWMGIISIGVSYLLIFRLALQPAREAV